MITSWHNNEIPILSLAHSTSSLRPLHANDYTLETPKRKTITRERLRWHNWWTFRCDARRHLDLKEHSQHAHLQHIVEPRSGLGWRCTLCARLILLDIPIETYEIHAFVATFDVNFLGHQSNKNSTTQQHNIELYHQWVRSNCTTFNYPDGPREKSA